MDELNIDWRKVRLILLLLGVLLLCIASFQAGENIGMEKSQSHWVAYKTTYCKCSEPVMIDKNFNISNLKK